MKYQDFSIYIKIMSSLCAGKILFLYFPCKDMVLPWLLIWVANYKRAFLSVARPVLLKFHSQNGFEVRRPYSYFEVTILAVLKMNKTSCVLCGNFISIYKINRTLHGRLGMRILPCRAESISHEWTKLTRERYYHHSKIKFVSPRCHVISSIYTSSATRNLIGLEIFPFRRKKMYRTNIITCFKYRPEDQLVSIERSLDLYSNDVFSLR